MTRRLSPTEREQRRSLGWAHRLGDASDVRRRPHRLSWADRFNARMARKGA